MPERSLRPCKKFGCPELTRDISGYCDKHRNASIKNDGGRWKIADNNRKNANDRGYGSRWKKARINYLKEHPLCVECLKETPARYTPATVVDHIKPHRGNMTIFWDKDNWQPLCKHHHDMKTASGQ